MGVVELVVLLSSILLVGVGSYSINKEYKAYKSKTDLTTEVKDSMHYYIFSVEDVNHIVYVESKEKLTSEEMNTHRLVIGSRFNLSDELSLNIGISYIGYFPEMPETN